MILQEGQSNDRARRSLANRMAGISPVLALGMEGVGMTETKWTPGPWMVERDPSSQDPRNFYPNIVSEEGEIVGTEGLFGNIETNLANAHLIAAAPDLYEALEAMAMCCPVCMGDCASANPPVTNCPMKAAHAALAKARGESND